MLSRRSKIAKYRSRVRTTTIFHWPPVPIFKFFFFWGGKGSNFKCHLSNSQKALPWPERRLMTYCAWGVSSDATCGHGEETQKRTETFMRQTGYFLQTTHVDVAPWNFAWAWGVMSRKYSVVIYFKFHENRPRGLGAVDGRKSPTPKNIYYVIEAAIKTFLQNTTGQLQLCCT